MMTGLESKAATATAIVSSHHWAPVSDRSFTWARMRYACSRNQPHFVRSRTIVHAAEAVWMVFVALLADEGALRQDIRTLSVEHAI